jgi:hypothetical protein
LEWKDVYVDEAGDYVVRFRAASQETRSFSVEVNGVLAGTISVKTPGWNDFQEYELTLTLQAGSNRIQLYNENSWMPNMDCMTIQKQGASDILNRQLSEAVARLTGLSVNSLLPTAFVQKANELIAQANIADLADSEKAAVLSEVENMLAAIDAIVPLCEEFQL